MRNGSNTLGVANLEGFEALHWKLRARVVCLGDLRTGDNHGKLPASGTKMRPQSLFRKDKITVSVYG